MFNFTVSWVFPSIQNIFYVDMWHIVYYIRDILWLTIYAYCSWEMAGEFYSMKAYITNDKTSCWIINLSYTFHSFIHSFLFCSQNLHLAMLPQDIEHVNLIKFMQINIQEDHVIIKYSIYIKPLKWQLIVTDQIQIILSYNNSNNIWRYCL
jgi:hypothetical protein